MTGVGHSTSQVIQDGRWIAVDSDPDVITWRNEMAAPDGSWFLIEEYAMVPRQP
jgi:hypothetical protein